MSFLQPYLLKHKFLDVFRSCQRVPLLGPTLFSTYIRLAAPYSGSVSPRITVFTPGHCRIELEERWALRNPFSSIHALALLNAGELSTGMAFLSLTQDMGRRAIITKLSGTYKKKARGIVFAECTIPQDMQAWLAAGGSGPKMVKSTIKNLQGEVVAECEAEWTVAPIKKGDVPSSSSAASTSAPKAI